MWGAADGAQGRARSCKFRLQPTKVNFDGRLPLTAGVSFSQSAGQDGMRQPSRLGRSREMQAAVDTEPSITFLKAV